MSASFRQIFELGQNALRQWNPKVPKTGSTSFINVVDFFCCAGGMTLGFASLPKYFQIKGGVDINGVALTSYKANYNVNTLNTDIRYLSPSDIYNTFKILQSNKPLVIIGCAPCQGFSAHRKKDHGNEDSRNTLIGYFADIATRLNPDFIVMENVPEIINGKFKNHYDEAKKIYNAAGYHLVQRIYNAAEFGVPQARKRAIIVASKFEDFNLPLPIFEEKDFKSVRDAIGNLPEIYPGQISESDPLHRCATHRQSTIDVISKVPKDGGSRPKGVGPKCLDSVKGFFDVYGRLSWDKPSITITQYARNPASGRFTHPEQNRGLSIREAARLQSFPDGFLLHGSLGQMFEQIGEAVPPLLALAIASQIALYYSSKK